MAIIIGTHANNQLHGTNEDDLLTGRGGDDQLDGGAGWDRAWAGGLISEYVLGTDGHLLTLTDRAPLNGDDGHDRLVNIEALHFGDGTLTVSREDVRVNTTTVDDQDTSAVTALTDGDYVVVWESQGQDGGEDGVFLQRYDSTGQAVGDEVLVNSTTDGDQEAPSVAALVDGGYVVTWQSDGQDGDGEGVYLQRYDSTGQAVGDQVLVNSTTTGAQDTTAVTALADGGYVVVWESYEQDGEQDGIYLQQYDAAGDTVGGEVLVNSTTVEDQEDPAVAALADGGYVVVWESDALDGDNNGIYAQRYDAAGDTVGGEVLVNSTTVGDQEDPAVVALTDGGYVVVWESDGQDGDADGVYLQRYDAAGDTVGGEVQVNSTTTDYQEDAAVAALADGGYVVVWESQGQDGDQNGIYAQRYDAAGDRVGGEVLVNATTVDDQDNPAVTGLADGGYVVTWDSEGQEGDNNGVYAQRYDATGAAVGGLRVTGTEGADRLTVGTHTLITVDGADGNDQLTGGASADILLGDSGLDSLTGNAGDDYLDGGSGADTMLGGAGHDTYLVDSIGDRITDTGGTDTVQASISYRLSAALEDLVLTGTDAINGTGNASANVLQGNENDNVLDGQAGGDLIVAGAGNDILLGRAGHDILVGGDGDDYLYGGIGHDQLTGGAGGDWFIFYTTLSATTNVDQITDFVVGEDEIRLSRGIFTTLALGDLNASAFRSGAGVSTAGDADDRIVYDSAAGHLYYDADGTGAKAAIKFATLTGAPLITEADFDIIAAPTQFSLTPLASLTSPAAVRATSFSAGLSAGGVVAYQAIRVGTDRDDRLAGGKGQDRLLGGGGADRLYGRAGHDYLVGDAGADVLVGGVGHDYLDGGTDADTMVGGAGNDTYLVDHIDDRVSETSRKGGVDTVRASVDYTLGTFVEDLVLTGSADLAGTGNAHDNWLQGNRGDNQLTGLAGRDYLAGGAGNDTYQIARGDGQDVIEDASGTADQLQYRGDITSFDLILSRQANDLRLAVQGSKDTVTVKDWYTKPTQQLESIVTGTGETLHHTQVDQLIQAMATFTQQTGLTWDQALEQRPHEVRVILAANWQ